MMDIRWRRHLNKIALACYNQFIHSCNWEYESFSVNWDLSRKVTVIESHKTDKNHNQWNSSHMVTFVSQKDRHVKDAQWIWTSHFLIVLIVYVICYYNQFQSGSLSGYMIFSSPRTLFQFLIGIVHFLVASNVARYRPFRSAWELGNTLLWRFRRRSEELSDSIAFVV